MALPPPTRAGKPGRRPVRQLLPGRLRGLHTAGATAPARSDRRDRARPRRGPRLPRHARARDPHRSGRRPLASDRDRAGPLRLVELPADAARRRGGRGAGDVGFCHYGWPDHLDIWRPQFVDGFARFAAAVAPGAGGDRPRAALVPDQRDLVLGLGRRHGRALQPQRPRPRRRAEAPAGARAIAAIEAVRQSTRAPASSISIP